MRFFVCLIDQSGGTPSESQRRRYERPARAQGLKTHWCTVGPVSTLIAEDAPESSPDQPVVVQRDGGVCVGFARLDNRAEVERWTCCESARLTDLELVLRAILRCGTSLIPELLGDFAFVVRLIAPGPVVAACDAFAVKKLYYVWQGGVLAFASRGDALAEGDRYDRQYLAELAGYCQPSPGLCVYAGVTALPAATIALFESGKVTSRPYWSCCDAPPLLLGGQVEAEATDMCRSLLREAVRSRVSGGVTWAQLSGGLDSSSMVSTAQWLVETEGGAYGLNGTVTYVDHHGTGADERRYSQAVVERFGLRNEIVSDWTVWQEDELGPPRVDQPCALYPFYVRDRRLCTIVRAAGGRVLLTGLGGDELFLGNMFFFADGLTTGTAWASAKEMARRAALGRVSFWELAYKNGFLPLLPGSLQRRLVRGEGQLPHWLTRGAINRYGLRSRAAAPLSYGGHRGRKYAHALAATVGAIPAKLASGVLDDALDVRHPYLYRPLVEFALRLPHWLTVRPHQRKWILREAMRGILPEVVRTRVGKGVLLGLLSWSTKSQRGYLEPLLRDPILAQLGIIDPKKLRAAFAAAQYEHYGASRTFADVQHTLALEAWLQVRSGRWPPRVQSTVLPSRTQVTVPSLL
jgi:asparagine synthase (glutamine-hydrolysing)